MGNCFYSPNYCDSTRYSPKTGRVMTVRTSDPCVQLYTGNSLGIPPMTVHEKQDNILKQTNSPHLQTSNGGIPALKHYAFCLETQRPPNGPNNQFKYPSCSFYSPIICPILNLSFLKREWVILSPREVYYHRTEHVFKIRETEQTQQIV